MYILKLEANGQKTDFGYAVDYHALYKLLKFGIRRGVILYGPAGLDHISQIRLLKEDMNAWHADPIQMLGQRIQGGTIAHVRRQAIPGLLEKKFLNTRDDEILAPFKGAITAHKRAAREIAP